VAKKSPGGLQTGPGHKDGNATIKEKHMHNRLRMCRKEVYTSANEEATEKDSYAC
jgi:hypothetical protein